MSDMRTVQLNGKTVQIHKDVFFGLYYSAHPSSLLPTQRDRDEAERFRRYLRSHMDGHEAVAYECAEPMSSANDPDTYGMGC